MTFHRFFARSSIVAAVMATLMVLTTATAQARGLLRDADAEYALQQIAAPILRAAGLSPTRVKVLIVNDSGLNAFVVGNDAIFIRP
jgi:predicted Zn-dependent protease